MFSNSWTWDVQGKPRRAHATARPRFRHAAQVDACPTSGRSCIRLIVAAGSGLLAASTWRARHAERAAPLVARAREPDPRCMGSARCNGRPAGTRSRSRGHDPHARRSARRRADCGRLASSAPPCRCAPAPQPGPEPPATSVAGMIAETTSWPLANGNAEQEMALCAARSSSPGLKKALSPPPGEARKKR